jgi:hypothetical protein
MKLNLKPYLLVDKAKRVAIPLPKICVSFPFRSALKMIVPEKSCYILLGIAVTSQKYSK